MNRRDFNRFALASVFTGLVGAVNAETEKKQSKSLFAACDNEEGKHFIAQLKLSDGILINSLGEKVDSKNLNSMEIPFRAHDTLVLSDQKSLSFGRRPHNQMVVCDFENKQQKIIDTSEGRHFYGHGCIENTRNILITSENDYDNARGVIGLRDSRDFSLLGEYESYGIGPHDIQLMPDKKNLVVANGGIQTHPDYDYGRRKLNLKTMQPSLVFIDIESGKKIDEYRLSNHLLSIRHLSVTAQGEVGIGTQYQGQSNREMPDYLVAYLGEDGLKTFDADQPFARSCRGYIADVAIDSNAQILAATSPRGNNLSLWNIKQQSLIKSLSISSPSGLCFDHQNQSFLVTNDKGEIFNVSLNSANDVKDFKTSIVQNYPLKWDNHLRLGA